MELSIIVGLLTEVHGCVHKMKFKTFFGKWMIFIFVFLIFALFLKSVDALPLCENEVAPNTNCQMTTPIINCTNPTYDLVDLNSSTVIIDDGALNEIVSSSGLYNFTFSQPEGTYNVILCNNQTRQMFVRSDLLQRDDGQEQNRVYWLLLLISGGLFGLGELTRDHLFPMVAGMLITSLAIYTATTGFVGLTNTFVINAIIIILAGLGMYLIAIHGYDWVTESF